METDINSLEKGLKCYVNAKFFIMKHCDGTRNTRVVYLFIPVSEMAVYLLYLHFSSFFTNRGLTLLGWLCVHHKTNTQTESQLEMVLKQFLLIT